MTSDINIAVHPFARYFSDSEDLYANQASFIQTRTARLNNHDVEQILFLEQAAIPQLEAFLSDNYWQNRIFLTKIMRVMGNLDTPEDYDKAARIEKVVTYPDRQTISWKETADIIKNRFPAENYHFWGAELHLHKNTREIIGGCVPFVHDRLQLPGIIDQLSCYIVERTPDEGIPLFSTF